MRLVSKQRHRQNFIIMLLVIMNSLNSTILFADNLYFITLSVLVLMLFVYVRKISIITSSLQKISLFLAVLFVLYILKQRVIHPLFMLNTSLKIFLSYLAIRLLKRDGFFYYLKEIVYLGAQISIPLYLVQLVSFDFIFNFISSVQNAIPLLARETANFSNIIVWGARPDSVYRNSGFMWEPGAFAAMLLFPIYIELNPNNKKINRKSIVLVIALLTTLSTMGYLALLVLFLYYIRTTGKKLSLLLLPLFIIVGLLILQQDFVLNKIQFELGRQDEIEEHVYTTNNESASLGRIGSFRHDVSDWKSDPIIGTGGDTNPFKGQLGTVINRTNGLSRFLLRFGVLGVLVYFSGVYRSFYFTSEHNKRFTGFIAITLLMILSFSNELLAKPLFLGFALIYVVAPTKKVLNFTPFKF